MRLVLLLACGLMMAYMAALVIAGLGMALGTMAMVCC